MNVDDILVRTRVNIAIDAEKVECDYFNVINGKKGSISYFMGEYMSNYSWAEITLAELFEIKKQNNVSKQTALQK